jgi:hypothetical protein
VARVGENKNAKMGLVGKPGEKKLLEKLVGNIKTYLNAIGWDKVDRIHLAEDTHPWQALMHMVIKLPAPQSARNFSNR